MEIVIKKMGFSHIREEWLMNCVTSTYHDLMASEKRVGHFKPIKGIRQSDMIIIYIFLLATISVLR